ncbi:hypothetical protein BTH_II1701 [Burkholderia thailandensis E264]|uniref:Uncharacterized protein n=1 Tax=Burkholderia thailandensis (strain ATCC 700388 / DSM 13276 / CCUG 48851 / CIP 106301 / E264) TaxID=271848 RepID=Q2T4K4_BURTA|nr:hypothetical protein BTH_II1701 [Burkholderia thailandensis E264]
MRLRNGRLVGPRPARAARRRAPGAAWPPNRVAPRGSRRHPARRAASTRIAATATRSGIRASRAGIVRACRRTNGPSPDIADALADAFVDTFTGRPAIVERTRLRVEPFDARQTRIDRASVRLPNRTRFALQSSKSRMMAAL